MNAFTMKKTIELFIELVHFHSWKSNQTRRLFDAKKLYWLLQLLLNCQHYFYLLFETIFCIAGMNAKI